MENVKLLPKVVDCKDCGVPFVLSSGEREFYLSHCLKETVRCPECRQKRRLAREQEAKGGAL